MNYCLINISGKANKFFANNWFGKTIIKKNKNEVRLLAIAILDKYLRETITLNILLFTKTRGVMAKENPITNYDNHDLQ